MISIVFLSYIKVFKYLLAVTLVAWVSSPTHLTLTHQIYDGVLGNNYVLSLSRMCELTKTDVGSEFSFC